MASLVAIVIAAHHIALFINIMRRARISYRFAHRVVSAYLARGSRISCFHARLLQQTNHRAFFGIVSASSS